MADAQGSTLYGGAMTRLSSALLFSGGHRTLLLRGRNVFVVRPALIGRYRGLLLRGRKSPVTCHGLIGRHRGQLLRGKTEGVLLPAFCIN
ncbi:MAG: hypothetical protein ABIJ11_05135 [Elusimicrobiota bacterium]